MECHEKLLLLRLVVAVMLPLFFFVYCFQAEMANCLNGGIVAEPLIRLFTVAPPREADTMSRERIVKGNQETNPWRRVSSKNGLAKIISI